MAKIIITKIKNASMLCMFSHATDGPPKIGLLGPSVAIFATGGPPGPSTAAIDGLPGPSMAP